MERKQGHFGFADLFAEKRRRQPTFRNLLAERSLLYLLLDEINDQLMAHGKLVKTGCVVDATLISSACRPRKQVDIEMVSTDRKEDEAPACQVTVSYSRDSEAA